MGDLSSEQQKKLYENNHQNLNKQGIGVYTKSQQSMSPKNGKSPFTDRK
jgi:hypothetical protein